MINEYLENKDINKLVQDVKERYKDFDRYSNNSDGLDLRYSLRGIEIDFNKKSDSGIKIYKNFTGTLYNGSKLENLKDKISDNIIIKNENSVWNAEVERLINNYLTEYNASTEMLNDPNKNNSNKFYAIKESLSNNLYKIGFLSIDGEHANSELKENVNDYIWIDDYNFLYSIKNSGIYIYNVISRKYGTLISGKEEFKLKEYSENILKYDDKSIKIRK